MEGYLGKSGEEYILYSKDNSVLGISSGTIEGRKLSKQNCQAIENGYDLDELADEYATGKSSSDVFKNAHQKDFTKGFQKALEILGDKKFSEEDMRMIFKIGVDNGFWRHRDGFKYEDESIKSLQQTEFDVEIEMTEDWYDGFKSKPKLDADGCLILRRK